MCGGLGGGSVFGMCGICVLIMGLVGDCWVVSRFCMLMGMFS